MKLQVSLLNCGRCGKPRGRHHLCRGTRSGRDRLRLDAGFTCSRCKRKVRNPFTHHCSPGSDFKARRRKQERQRKAARVRERKREKAAAARERKKHRAAEAAARRRAAAKKRRAEARTKAKKPRAAPHDPHNCKEGDCQRYPCRLYRDGYDDGLAAAEGMAS